MTTDPRQEERLKAVRDRLYSRGGAPRTQSGNEQAKARASQSTLRQDWSQAATTDRPSFQPKPQSRQKKTRANVLRPLQWLGVAHDAPQRSSTESTVEASKADPAVPTDTPQSQAAPPVKPRSIRTDIAASQSRIADFVSKLQAAAPTVSVGGRRSQTSNQTESTVAQATTSKDTLPPTGATQQQPETMPTKSKRRYRKYFIAIPIAFFAGAVIIASFNMLVGNGIISGDNIGVSVTGPFTVGGGEVLSMQVGVTNQNNVPIEAATLILRYPNGTQSADESGEEIFVQRLPLDTIAAGETLNVPVRITVFGEENEEKTVEAEVEYRIEGSNSTFAKVAEPYRFKITSSPISIQVDSVEKISAGQETEITLTVSSNATNDLADLLVRAEYPFAFEYVSSTPEPVSGENIWLIDRLEPEQEQTITITGIPTGLETETQVTHFTVGIGGEQYNDEMIAVFATAESEFLLEQSFFELSFEVGGEQSRQVVKPGDTSRIVLIARNTLSDPIYDAKITAQLSGNALSDTEIDVTNGFYNSVTDTITWDVSSVANLDTINPGETRSVAFTVAPSEITDRTPQIAIDAAVTARRVFDSQASEETFIEEQAVVKVETELGFLSETGRNTSVFSDSGPIPPVAETATTYTLSLMFTNTTNDVSNAVARAVLPTYVTWEDSTAGAGEISYNESTREVIWEAGEINANQSKVVSFQISFLPSQSQIGTTPVLLGRQRITARDRFTGTDIAFERSQITTKLSEEAGFERFDGEVVAAE